MQRISNEPYKFKNFNYWIFFYKAPLIFHVAIECNFYRKPHLEAIQYFEEGRVRSLRTCVESRIKDNQKSFCIEKNIWCISTCDWRPKNIQVNIDFETNLTPKHYKTVRYFARRQQQRRLFGVWIYGGRFAQCHIWGHTKGCSHPVHYLSNGQST